MNKHSSVIDARKNKVMLVSHCCLNQNSKVWGLARYPAMIKPLMELFLTSDTGIIQMTCPELTYLGSMRWGNSRDQYDTPMFRKHCRKIAEGFANQAENYLRSGTSVKGVIMVDGSPVCSLNYSPQPKGKGDMFGGMVWYRPESHHIEQPGIYCEILKDEFAKRNLDEIPFIAIPELEKLGSAEDALKQIEKMLEQL